MSIQQDTSQAKKSAAGRNDSSAPLGSIYQHDFRASQNDDRLPRFALQSAARELAPNHRVRMCLRARVPGRETVEVRYSQRSGRAYYQNLICCGRVWVCPICASKITEQRRVILEALANQTERVGFEDFDGTERVVLARRFYLTMVTFTISHNRSERAQDVIARIEKAYKSMWRGRSSQAFREGYRVLGTLRAFELTVGENGWHPHYHLLLFRNRTNSETEIKDMDIELTLRWQDACASAGAVASLDRGVQVSAGDDRVTEYINKIGQQVGQAVNRWTLAAEVTKYPAKRGRKDSRTMWDLLADYMIGDVKAGELWIEGVEALKGAKHLVASKGLWKLLGLEKSLDDEAALLRMEESPLDRLLASLDIETWRLVIRYNVRGTLLEVANSGGDIEAFCDNLRKRAALTSAGE